MGVKGLTQFVESRRDLSSRRRFNPVDSDWRTRRSPPRDLLVVDGNSLLRDFYTPDLDWTCGGEWLALRDAVHDFVRRFRRVGFDLVVIFDGAVEKSKRRTWTERRRNEQSKIQRIFDVIITGGRRPDNRLCLLPSGLSTYVRAALKSCECTVFNSFGEADREIAQYCIDHDAYGVLGQDSDYFIYPLTRHFGTKNLSVRDREVVMVEHNLGAITKALGLELSRLPVFAALCGNDVLDVSILKSFHQRVTNSSHYSGSDAVRAVAEFVARFPSSITNEEIGRMVLNRKYMDRFKAAVAMYDLRRDKDCAAERSPVSSISADVLALAKERHYRAENSHLVYPLMRTAEIDIGSTLEDPLNRCGLPDSGLLLRLIRRRVYGLLLGVRSRRSSASSEELIIGENAAHEWCVYRGNDLREADVVKADPLPSSVASLDELWLGSHSEAKCLKAFLYCMGWEQQMRDLELRDCHPHHLILCTVLHFFIDERVLYDYEIDAFLAQAVDLKYCRVSDLRRMDHFSRLDARAVHLGALFMRAVYVATFAYNSCGMVCDDSVTSPWHFFDGVLFHCKYVEAKRGTPLAHLCRCSRVGSGSIVSAPSVLFSILF